MQMFKATSQALEKVRLFHCLVHQCGMFEGNHVGLGPQFCFGGVRGRGFTIVSMGWGWSCWGSSKITAGCVELGTASQE